MLQQAPFEEVSPACDELWLLEEPEQDQDDEEHQHLVSSLLKLIQGRCKLYFRRQIIPESHGCLSSQVRLVSL